MMSAQFKLAWTFAKRELRGGLHGFRIFLACLALGVAAIAAVGTVRASIQSGLETEGAALLGGDAVVRFTYRFANDDERTWMSSIASRVSETTDFRSMVVVNRAEVERGLTQVQAVDDLYPLIGETTLDPPMPLAQAFAGTDTFPGGVLERVLADRLGLSAGDTFNLGDQTFVLSAILVTYPDNSGGGFGLGPRTLVLLKDLENSGLLATGTLMESNYRLDLPNDVDLEALETEAETKFENSGLRWRDARAGAPGVARFVDRIGAFLILIGLSGLAVGGVGVSSAVRSYLSGKAPVIAILKTLGASRRTIFLTYFLQIGILTLVGVALGLILGAAIPLAFAPIFEARLPIPSDFTLHAAPLFEAAIYGALAALIFTLWPLARTEDIKPATLFRDAFGAGKTLPAPKYLIATLLLLAILIGAAILFTGTAFLTLWTTGGILFALALLVTAAVIARWTASRFRRLSRGRPALRAALSSIGARGGETTSVVLSLGLGLSVLAAVGQIDGNLRGSIANELPDIAPSYFFVDIQPDQIDGFRARLDNDAQVSEYEAAPMLRGIITQINGIPARDVTDHWVLRGDRGITYSAQPGDGTIITEGEWWPEDYSGPPLISFSAEEGLEMGLNIGDTITTNILGRDIEATIASFREVSFEDAGMGFIMSMNPAALQGAPHSWISTVYSDPSAEAAILRDLATSYPNITAIRVRDAIDQVVQLLGGISAATRYGALATLLTGFLVLIGAAAAGIRARTYEAAVLKTLGASRSTILLSFALRSALLGLAAGLVALAAGIAGGWAVSTFIMETDFTPIWSSAGIIILGGMGATLLAGLAFAWQPLAAKPAQVLRARE
ncbi:putative ABC transport system permease protein [Octadecabacter temperatus]|uniref:FtsX-like permease family protein n=1 Tax=Octadecabacter temperatus TaxID=1458307 RepID=A0A0K0Y823_9RHOB|nr:FtsX-like permease family protein [Octadecabacter temperatus]AKS47113.1 FtsX-like permease family protein [Octadecabacter temperatus]SIO46366.1 putative ABC transport system permease protein [Octadecabacter temperatus]